MLLDIVGILANSFARLDRKELALIVPFVEGGVLIEFLVALQADEFGRVYCGERLGHFGLADARLAFQQERAFEKFHQPQCGSDVAVGDIADGGKLVRYVSALDGHCGLSFRGAVKQRAGNP